MFRDRSPHRLFAHIPEGVRARNLFRLNDGTYTTNDPVNPELIDKVYLGAHNEFLTDEEVSQLTAAGYGEYIS
jgi:hypothetical protein